MAISNTSDPKTGTATVLINLKRCFAASGLDCTLIFKEDILPSVDGVLKELLFTILLPFTDRVMRCEIFDINPGDGIFVWFLRFVKMQRTPVLVARSHGLEHVMHESYLAEAKAGRLKLSWKYPLYHGGFRLWQVKQYLKRADMALFLNEYDREYAIEKFGVRPESAEIVDNGIPDVFLGQAVSFEPTADIKIALAGSFLQRKGIDYSVPALNNLLAKHDQLSVTFFGTGVPADGVLRRFYPAVAGRVHVMPRYDHENLPGLLKGFHILLFPSLTEGFPLAPLEAMACGLAAVVSRIPWVADRLEDGVNAIIIPAKDQVAIESAIQRLIEDPALLIKLRKAGYDFAQGYSWRRVAESNLRLYEKAIERKSRKGQR
jgi:glycosyltransferase involved in cell wall biosynthesis